MCQPPDFYPNKLAMRGPGKYVLFAGWESWLGTVRVSPAHEYKVSTTLHS